MREIKFRAWMKKYNQFWDVVQVNFVTNEILAPDGEWYEYNELVQYTGIKDKNGKEIYEGDIIQHGENAYSPFENSISIVEWFDENFMWIFKKNHIKKDANDKVVYDIELLGNISGGYDDKFEVIGNIFENKELLNK
jgi:uncharacterized phage protein (TIGR01671 family)